MSNETILIKSTDNTDTLIFVDKIQYIRQTRTGVEIGLLDNTKITTTAEFDEVVNALSSIDRC